MTKDQIKTKVNTITSDELDDETFDLLLDTAQIYIEQQRPWMILRDEDVSLSVLSSAPIDTAYSLPTDFDSFFDEFPIQLENGSSINPLREIPIARKLIEKESANKFFCKHTTKKFYLTGSNAVGSVIHIFYKKFSTLVSADDNNEWTFPSRFHGMLVWLVGAFHEKGVDYDPLNMQQGSEQETIFLRLYNSLVKWDENLQAQSIKGLDDPYPQGDTPGYRGNSTGGHIRF